MKSYVITFYKAYENNRIEEIIKAAGIGENCGDAVESAKTSIIDEYPNIGTFLWTAIEHHTKMKPGKLD